MVAPHASSNAPRPSRPAAATPSAIVVRKRPTANSALVAWRSRLPAPPSRRAARCSSAGGRVPRSRSEATAKATQPSARSGFMESPGLDRAAETWAIPAQAATSRSPGRVHGREPSRRSHDAAAGARIAAVPREVVLLLPPSPEPPAVAGEALRAAVAGALGCAPEVLSDVRLRRMSFDARPRQRRWRLVVDAWSVGESPPPPLRTTPPTFSTPAATAPHVVVVGSGPAGIFCALDCLAAGLNVTVLERGRDVQARRHALAAANRGLEIDPESNYCFGEGGAGTYSDGKLYTRAGSRPAVRSVLETLVAHGAPPEILASWPPPVGSNRLPLRVRAVRGTLGR